MTDETEAESRIDRQSLVELPPERPFSGYLLNQAFFHSLTLNECNWDITTTVPWSRDGASAKG
jgi:hypothetical protein